MSMYRREQDKRTLHLFLANDPVKFFEKYYRYISLGDRRDRCFAYYLHVVVGDYNHTSIARAADIGYSKRLPELNDNVVRHWGYIRKGQSIDDRLDALTLGLETNVDMDLILR